MRRTVQLPDRDRMLETLIATADRVVKPALSEAEVLDAATLSIKKPVPAPVSPPNTSPQKT